MNSIGWTLVAAGAVGLLASIAGILHIFFDRRPIELTAIDLDLHDTYYLVSRPIWPLFLCVVLSAGIGIVGYMQTTHFFRRIIPDRNSPLWQSSSNNE